MKKGAENKVKLGRRPRAGEAASEWLRARITPGEAANLGAVAKLLGRSSSEAARLACALLHAALFFRAPEQVAAVVGVEPVAGALSWAAVMVLAMIAAAKCPAVSVATKAEHAAIVELVGLGLVELLGVELAKSAALRENMELWTQVSGAASMIVEQKAGPALLTLAPPTKKGKPSSSVPSSSSGKGPFRISVVSCSARKLDHMAPARELYSSDLFRKSLAFAEASSDLVVIASAKLGLVMPDDLIEPYDLRLAALSEAERAVWAERVVWVLVSMLSKSQAARGVELQILAGYAYAEPLRVAAEARGWVCRFPLAGLGIGARRRWLKVSLARLAGPAASVALGELGAARGALVAAAGELSASVKAPRRRRVSSSSASSSSVKRSALLPAGYKGPAPASPAEASGDWWAKSSSLPKGWDDLIAGEVFADVWDGNACGWLSPRNVKGCADKLAELLPIASLSKLRGPVWAVSGQTCVEVAGALLVRQGRAVRQGRGLVAPG